MPFFQSKHLQTLTTFVIGVLYLLVLIRMSALLSTTNTASETNPLIELEGSIRHASFIKLQPFGFTGTDSSFAMNVQVTMRKVNDVHANALQLTNRTVFSLMLCNENDWKTIKSVVPSYCNTQSYKEGSLCQSFPLDVPIKSTTEDSTYTSTTTVSHAVTTEFFGRLVVSSCELKEKTAKRSCSVITANNPCTFPPLEKEVEMRLAAGLTMKNNNNIYIGFENDQQSGMIVLLLAVCIVLVTIWIFLLIAYRKYSNKLQVRMINIMVSKAIHYIFMYAYWIKRQRGDVWASYKEEMMQLESALDTLAFAVMLECLLLISVGWSITQKNGKLSNRSWKMVYCK